MNGDTGENPNKMPKKYDFIPPEQEMQEYIDTSLEGLFHKSERKKGSERQKKIIYIFGNKLFISTL